MPSVPASQETIALFLSCILFGLYLATFLHALRWLLYADSGWKLRSRKATNWIMVLATTALFGCALVNLSIALHGLETTLKGLEKVTSHTVARGVSRPFTRPTVVAVITCTTANVSVLIADCIMIHRCFAVWGGSRRLIVFPSLLWIGGVVCTILQAYVQIVQHRLVTSAWQPVNMTVGPGTILTPFWGSTIVLNAYCTSLIVYRIWSVTRISESSSSSLLFVMRVVVESGFLYLAIAVAHFVTWWTPSNFAIVIVSYINIPIIGITFNLISIRTAKFKAQGQKEEQYAHPASALRFAPASMKTTILDIRHLESNPSVSEV
ncbi:hypothetical protein BDQ17DRAFT_1424729 [Cyathus striatus]|nr:hypothetical protein BDQ17DRAFT_1424729 [Cyathus striatus]